SKYTLASFFDSVAYNYAEEYFSPIRLRTDGTYKFGVQNRWGTFPAGGLAWRVKYARLLQDVVRVCDLELTASFVMTGNQAGIDDVAARGLWSGESPYADVYGTPLAGIGPLQLGNDELKWEKTAQANVGVDASFFKNRINIVFDYYDKYTSDLLL